MSHGNFTGLMTSCDYIYLRSNYILCPSSVSLQPLKEFGYSHRKHISLGLEACLCLIFPLPTPPESIGVPTGMDSIDGPISNLALQHTYLNLSNKKEERGKFRAECRVDVVSPFFVCDLEQKNTAFYFIYPWQKP